MGKLDDAERLEVRSLDDWSRWLAEHHAEIDGVWLVTAKRSTGRQPFDYEAAVVEALRYGWVDSTKRSLDDERSMLWFAPRRPGSGWARPNKVRIARLEQDGRLQAAGRAAVEAAKANGSWELLDSVEDLVVPEDLTRALAGVEGAGEVWGGFSASVRKMMLAWLATAKRPETRARRVATIAEKAGRGEKALG